MSTDDRDPELEEMLKIMYTEWRPHLWREKDKWERARQYLDRLTQARMDREKTT